MRFVLTLALCLGLTALPLRRAEAQPAGGAGDEELSDEELDEEEEEETPTLRAPMVEDPGGWDDEEEEHDEEDAPRHRPTSDDEEEEDAGDDEEEEDEEEDADEETLPDPDRVEERLDGAGTDPTVAPWSTPATIFELHGYMRMRGEFQDQFSLGRGREGMDADSPFEDFITYEDVSLLMGPPTGGCAGGRSPLAATCNQRALAYANMRLRLEPTIHLSDDVRVRMQIDVFDNLVMGSTPDSYGTNLAGTPVDAANTAYVPLLANNASMAPSIAGRNSLGDSIVARRAWAEVRNRGLGEVRFGRMGNHWGLGMMANDGRGIDQDYQSDVDRIMLLTRLFGFYFFGAWDFASEGFIQFRGAGDSQGLAYDRSRNDDVDQFTFGAARRNTPEETALALARGEAVLNAGLYFVYRTQNLTSAGTADPLAPSTVPTFSRRGFELYVPDVWVQFLYEDLRLEVEAAMQIGTIDNLLAAGNFDSSTRRNVLSFGVAFEGEYHLLNDQLGIYFNAGFASGDADAEGLTLSTAYDQLPTAAGPIDTTISTFGFHPGYRVDLILWRTIMRQIAGAYYFAPGVSYDFIRSAFGQLLGARANVVWSRASEPVQTWGNAADLGVEIDAMVYYRSEDGPDLLDGFYASLQYGILFPLSGLGYLGTPPITGGGGQNAQTLRLVLGVSY